MLTTKAIQFGVIETLPSKYQNTTSQFGQRNVHLGSRIYVRLWKPKQKHIEKLTEAQLIDRAKRKAQRYVNREHVGPQVELHIEHGYLDDRGFFWTRDSKEIGVFHKVKAA